LCTPPTFCCSLLPPLPISSLFPYTTLFRSSFLDASGLEVGLPKGQMGNSEVGHLNIGAGRVVFQDLPRISEEIAEGNFFRKEELDRKSTRLNSSHVSISYAVFCLKKKKTGMEHVATRDSGAAIVAKPKGSVEHVESNEILVRQRIEEDVQEDEGEIDRSRLADVQR